jgi:hypothetical protein
MTVRARQIAPPSDIDLERIDVPALQTFRQYFPYSFIKVVHDALLFRF